MLDFDDRAAKRRLRNLLSGVPSGLAWGTAALVASVPCTAQTFNVAGGGTITSLNSAIITDGGTTGGIVAVATVPNDVMTILNVNRTNTTGIPVSEAIDVGQNGVVGYTTILGGSSLQGVSSAYALKIETGSSTVQGDLTFTSAGQSVNTFAGPNGFVVNSSSRGNISINTGADIFNVSGTSINALTSGQISIQSTGTVINSQTGILAETGKPISINLSGGSITVNGNNARGISATTDSPIGQPGTGTISIDASNTVFNVNGVNASGISAFDSNAITIGRANGGFAGTINAPNAFGIIAENGSGTITIAPTGVVDAGEGIFVEGGGFTVDNFGSITGTSNSIHGSAGQFTILLENGSTTIGKVSLGSGNDTVAVYAGANIANASFDLSGSDDTLSLRGIGTRSGNFDLSKLSNAEIVSVDSGSWTFSNLPSYTGSVSISSTLLLNDAASFSSLTGAGNVALGANTLTLTNAGGTFSGVISGSGGLTLSAGTETLTGTNTYTGGTKITGGTLQIGNGGATGSIAGSVTDNGTLVLNLSGGTTLTGVISGTGALVNTLGTNVLTGTDTYGGGTTISGGTLQIGNGGSAGSITGNVTNNGTLTFNRSDTAMVMGGVISGTGKLSIIGSGMVTLNGVNTYSGGTTVSSGTLKIGDASHTSAQILGPVTVSGTGTVSGHGTTGAISNPSGTIAPGGTIGTLTVASYTQGSAGTLLEEVSPAGASELIVTGTASLAGSLVISPDPGTYGAGTDFKLISAGSVIGTFSSIMGASFTGLTSTVVYSATGVDLTLSAATPNSNALSNALGGIVTINAASGPGALDYLTGEIYASLHTELIADDRLIRQSVLDHLAGASGDGIVLWGDTFTSWGNVDGNANAATIGHSDTGLIAGLETSLDDDIRAGIAAAWTGQRLSVPNRGSAATGHGSHVIAYAKWVQDILSLTVGVDYGSGSNTVRRSIAFLSQNDTSHPGDHTTQIFGEVAYSMQTAGVMVDPYASLAYIAVSSGAFAETGGASSDLAGNSKTSSLGYSTLGVRFLPDTIPLEDLELMPRISLGWQHALRGFTPAQSIAFTATAQTFQVLGAPLSTDAVVAQLGFDVAMFARGKFTLGYDGLISDHEKDHAIRAKFVWAL